MKTIKKKIVPKTKSIWDKPVGKRTLKVKQMLIEKGVNPKDIDIDWDDFGNHFEFFVSVGKKPYQFVRPFSSLSYRNEADMKKIVKSVSSWYKKAPVTKKPATKTSDTKKTTKTSSKRIENVIKINGKRYVMDESKVKMKNGKKFFYLFKTYQKQNWGRMRKWWLYVPIKKKGREQWEVYHIDKNDPTYGVFGRGKTARKY